MLQPWLIEEISNDPESQEEELQPLYAPALEPLPPEPKKEEDDQGGTVIVVPI